MITDLHALRRRARRAYQAGDLASARALQVEILNRGAERGEREVGDYQRLALTLYSAGDLSGAGTVLREALRDTPGHLDVMQNLAMVLCEAGQPEHALEVLERAVTAAPRLPNIHDLLARACVALGDLDRARSHGSRSLELKDRESARSGKARPLPGPPPPFRPGEPERNILAFSLFGDRPRYLNGALENASRSASVYPGWRCRFYCDDTVPHRVRVRLTGHGAQVKLLPRPARRTDALFWRFLVADDPGVDRYLVRDADSVVNRREARAVRAWLESDRHFHVMRDHPKHTGVMMAGMWGGCAGAFGHMRETVAAFEPAIERTASVDQLFLRLEVWPTARQSVLVHDSFFRVLHGVDFPPGSDLPAGEHVGQDWSRRPRAAR